VLGTGDASRFVTSFYYDFTSRHYNLFLQCALTLWRCVSERSWFLYSGPLISFDLVFSDLLLISPFDLLLSVSLISSSQMCLYLPKSTLLSRSYPDWYGTPCPRVVFCLFVFVAMCTEMFCGKSPLIIPLTRGGFLLGRFLGIVCLVKAYLRLPRNFQHLNYTTCIKP
jgi:hypothetical protein